MYLYYICFNFTNFSTYIQDNIHHPITFIFENLNIENSYSYKPNEPNLYMKNYETSENLSNQITNYISPYRPHYKANYTATLSDTFSQLSYLFFLGMLFSICVCNCRRKQQAPKLIYVEAEEVTADESNIVPSKVV